MAKQQRHKRLNIIHYVDGGIFPMTVMFIQGFSFDETIAELKDTAAPDYWIKAFESKTANYIDNIDCATAFSIDIINTDTKEERHLFFIYSKKYLNKNDPYDMLILAHECLHICQFALPGILDRNKEHEAEAYYHSHLMEQIIKQL